MEQIAKQTLPPGMGYDWSAMSYQEKVVGNQIYFVFALAVLLVYFVLAGQYESWIQPLSVILAVPLALLGTVGALDRARASPTISTPRSASILLIALASKNAILIVEYAREKRQEGMEIVEAAVEAARLRFRPILMTSFAFILGVVPLVLATGAGANARKSIGIAVFSGMLASTCLAVLFVPSFYVVLQRFEEWRRSRKTGKKADETAPPTESSQPASVRQWRTPWVCQSQSCRCRRSKKSITIRRDRCARLISASSGRRSNASPWCCRAAARSARSRPASTRAWRKPTCIRTGSPASRSAPSMPR